MNQGKIPKREIAALFIGEVIVSVAVCLIFLLLKSFDYKVVSGVVLGSAVTIFNFLLLCILINRALDKCLSLFTPEEQTAAQEPNADVSENQPFEEDEARADDVQDEPDDAAAKFARENAAKIQNAAKLSYIFTKYSSIVKIIIHNHIPFFL